MFFDEDNEPRRKPQQPRNLDQLSVSELAEYIEALKAEISRVEAVIVQRESHRASIEAIFGGGK